MPHILLGIVLLSVGYQTCVTAEEKKVTLFNGQDLSGWTAVFNKEGTKMEDVWRVEQGALICGGQPPGYVRTKDEYENYVLTLEWRWKPGGKGGNSGVLVHTSSPMALGVWPKSIDVQLAAGNAGDFWIIGTDLDVPNESERKRDRRHLNLTARLRKARRRMEQKHRQIEVRVDPLLKFYLVETPLNVFKKRNKKTRHGQYLIKRVDVI